MPSRCLPTATTLGPEPAARNTRGEIVRPVIRSIPCTDTDADLLGGAGGGAVDRQRDRVAAGTGERVRELRAGGAGAVGAVPAEAQRNARRDIRRRAGERRGDARGARLRGWRSGPAPERTPSWPVSSIAPLSRIGGWQVPMPLSTRGLPSRSVDESLNGNGSEIADSGTLSTPFQLGFSA